MAKTRKKAARKRKTAARKAATARRPRTAKRRTGTGRAAKKAKKVARGRTAAKARKTASKGARRTTARRTAAKKTAAKKTAAKKTAPKRRASARPAGSAAASGRGRSTETPAAPPRRPPTLDRERRTIRDDETIVGPPSSLDLDRTASAVRSGRREYEERLREHTSTGPAMTGGDVDADWEDAEAVGDEAPGGDNPTPDQDVVDEIGRALGVTYEDNEELQGGDEIVERDRRRWELDPASREDYNEEE